MLLNEQEFERAWSVSFTPIPEGCLHLTYPDGEERVFDVWDYLKRHDRTKGFWAKLFNQDYFNTVKSVHGMPDWEDGLINISPEVLLTESTLLNTLTKGLVCLLEGINILKMSSTDKKLDEDEE